MQIIEAIILGAVQGLTEFIPISSSGHLLLVEKIFGFNVGSLLFDVMLHLGTLLALFIYFWTDIKQIIRSIVARDRSKLWVYLIVGTFPAAIAGYFLESSASTSFRSVGLVAVNLILVAFIMIWVEKVPANKNLDQTNSKDALIIGVAQALALIPGVSRSGATIAAGMGRHLTREAAARFSFLLAIPITIGAILKLLSNNGFNNVTGHYGVFLVGVIVSAGTGYLTIKFLLKYLVGHKLNIFAYYRIGLGLVILVSLGAGWL